MAETLKDFFVSLGEYERAIEVLRRQPRDYAPILDKCEQSLQRCQTLITELGPDDEDDPRETLH